MYHVKTEYDVFRVAKLSGGRVGVCSSSFSPPAGAPAVRGSDTGSTGSVGLWRA